MDVICQAKSGMGKTAVFVLTTLQQLDLTQSGDVLVMCLCHTRELAFQIQNEYDRFSKYMPEVITTQCTRFPISPLRPDGIRSRHRTKPSAELNCR